MIRRQTFKQALKLPVNYPIIDLFIYSCPLLVEKLKSSLHYERQKDLLDQQLNTLSERRFHSSMIYEALNNIKTEENGLENFPPELSMLILKYSGHHPFFKIKIKNEETSDEKISKYELIDVSQLQLM